MPSKKNVEQQKNDHNEQNHYIDSNTSNFIKKYDAYDTSKQNYISSIINVAEHDPKAFIEGNMAFNGFKKNRKEEWYLPKNNNDDFNNDKRTDDNKEFNKDDNHLKDDEEPSAKDVYDQTNHYNSKPGFNYGMLGNALYRISYSLTYNALSSGAAIYNGYKNGKQLREEQDKAREELDNNQPINDVKTDLEKYVDKIEKENSNDKEKSNKILLDNEKEIDSLVSKSLGFERIDNVLEQSNFDANNSGNVLDNINSKRNPNVPSTDEVNLRSKHLNDEIKEYHKDPEKYMKEIKNQEQKNSPLSQSKELDANDNVEEQEEKDIKNDNKLNWAIAEGTVDGDNRVLNLSEIQQSLEKEKATHKKMPYTLSFSDGLAKEYKSLEDINKDFVKNSPKIIHEQIKDDYKNTPSKTIDDKKLLDSLGIDDDEDAEMNEKRRKARLKRQHSHKKDEKKDFNPKFEPEIRM